MRILLVADAASIWTTRYLKNVLVPSGLEVVVFTPAFDNPVVEEICRQYHIELIVADPLPQSVARLPLLRGLFARRKAVAALRKSGPYDVAHVHQVLKHRVKIAFAVKRWAPKIVLSYWGGDLLGRSRRQLGELSRYLRRADIVTVNSSAMITRLHQTYGKRLPDVRFIPFGVDGFKEIDRLTLTEERDLSKLALGLPLDRIIVVVGYNGRKQQQHLKVLEALADLPREVQERLVVVVPMTYGAPSAYLAEIANALQRLECESRILTAFLDSTNQARLCISADVFIHAQTSDALSASLQEFLYSGVLALNGSWLEYPELDDFGCEYDRFDNMEDLRRMLMTRLQDWREGDRERRVTAHHAGLSRRAWVNVTEEWQALYSGENVLH